MEFRQYQKEIIEEGLSVLKTHRFKVKGVVHFLKDSTIIQGKQLIDLIV